MGCSSSVGTPDITVNTPGPHPHRSFGDTSTSSDDHTLSQVDDNPSVKTGKSERTVQNQHDQNKPLPVNKENSKTTETYAGSKAGDQTKADDSINFLEADQQINTNDPKALFSTEGKADVQERQSPEGIEVYPDTLHSNKVDIDATSSGPQQQNNEDVLFENVVDDDHSTGPRSSPRSDPSKPEDGQDKMDTVDSSMKNQTEGERNSGREGTDKGGNPSVSVLPEFDHRSKREQSAPQVKVKIKTAFPKAEARKSDDIVDMEEVKNGLLFGDIRVRCPMSVRIVRIFLSSTFTDTKQERNQLLERSYPHLKDVCKRRGYEFQLVDMRWGVGQSIANDHMTSDMCFKEIELCQKLSTGPNFVTLLSHKYGYYAYPRQIEASLFEQLMGVLDKEDDKAFMRERWFILDTNVQPPHYIIKPISTHFPDFMSRDFQVYNKTRKKWNAECDRLIEILIKAAHGVFEEEEASEFIKGVTDREIEFGILKNPRRDETCLWLGREIEDLDVNHEHISWFDDTLKDSAWDKRNAQLLGNLKDSLKASLPESNLQMFNVKWSKTEIDPVSIKTHREYIDRLCTEFESRVEDMFAKAVDAQEAQELGDSLLDELAHHTELAQRKCKDFYGRDDVMKKIKDYLLDPERNKPLVIYGTSGSGKSTVVAMTMRETWEWRKGKVAIVTRFIGASPESSRVGSVLASMTRQIQRMYQKSPKSESLSNEEFASFNQTCEEFKASLELATKERPLVVLIDSFEQLDPLEEAMNLIWIPLPLPDNVKVIISTLEEDTLVSRLKPFKYELKGFSTDDAVSTLKQWLNQENRCLTDGQLSEVRTAFTQCSIPLYIRLALQETLRWKSFSPGEETRLKETVKEAIHAFFERTEQNHGRVFTLHTLGYLTLARRGLSESEMEDILSCDDDVLNEIFAFWVPPIRRIPPLILVRLRNDLDLYIAQREIDRVPVMLWNHQLFKDVAHEMYCTNDQVTKLLHQNLAEFFSGKWSGCKKDFEDRKGLPGSEDRQVAAQPVKHGNEANLRKLSNLPWHLAHLDSEKLKKECLFNMEFLTVKMKALGIRAVIDDFTDAIDCFPEEKKLFQTVKETIQISQKAILRNVNELPTQLMNRLKNRSKSDKGLSALQDNCKRVAFPILVCDQPLLMPPGGHLQYSLPSHEGRVLSLDLTSDGYTAVTCGDDKKIMVWDVSVGNMLFSFDTGEEEPIKALLASNDQSIVVVTNQSLSTFGTDTGKLFNKIPFKKLHLTNVPAVCIAGKSKNKKTNTRIAKANVVVVTDSQIHVFGAKKLEGGKGEDIAQLAKGRIGKHSHCIGHQDYIAVTDEDHYYLRVFQMKTRKDTATRRIYPALDVPGGGNDIGPTIDGLCFSGNGQFLFVSNWREGDILCLDTEDLKETSRMPGVSEDKPTNLRVTKEEGSIYFPSEKRVVIRHHVTRDRACIAEHPCSVIFCATLGFNPLVTVGDDSVLRLWKYDETKLAWPERESDKKEEENMIRSLCLFRTNPRYVLATKASADRSRQVLVQDLLTGRVVRKANIVRKPNSNYNLEMEVYEEEPANVTAIIRSPSGCLCVLDLDQMRVTDRLNISASKLGSSEKRSFTILRRRQELLAVGSDRKSIGIYNLKTNTVKCEIDCEKETIENFQVDVLETVLAVATEDVSCIIYNLESNQRIAHLTPNDFFPDDPDGCDFLKVTCVTSRKKENYIVLETDFLLKIWSTQMGGKLSNDLELYHDSENPIDTSTITEATPLSDNKLLTAAEDGTTRVFEIKSGKLRKENFFHRKDVHLSTDQSDTYLTYGEDAKDQTIAVWSLNKDEPVATFSSDHVLDHVTLSQDGKFVVGSLRNPARIVTWHVQDGTVTRDKCMNGQQLFPKEQLDVDLNVDEEAQDKAGFSTDDDLDSPDEDAEDL